MIGIYPAQGPLAGRFNVRSCFYPSYQGDPAYVSLSVLENRPDLRQNDRDQTPLGNLHPRFSLGH